MVVQSRDRAGEGTRGGGGANMEVEGTLMIGSPRRVLGSGGAKTGGISRRGIGRVRRPSGGLSEGPARPDSASCELDRVSQSVRDGVSSFR
jgi:hypothetical protein